MIRPEVRAAMAAHADCPSDAMTHDERGARCTACGTTWHLTRSSEGKPVGYVTPPSTAAARRRVMAWAD